MQSLKISGSFSVLALIQFTVAAITALILVSCTDSSNAEPKLIFKDAPKAGVVAKIGGKEITEEELIGESKVEFFELKKKEYEIKMDRLNQLIVDQLIGAEAKSAGMPTEEFIAKKITKGEIKVTDKEFNDFVKERQVPESQINPQIKERINTFIATQKREKLVQQYLAKLTKSNPVEVYFTKPKLDIQVELGQSPVEGPDSAKVTLVAFSDFQCPYCSRGAQVMQQIKKKYGNKVKLAFKHFPLSFHPQAKPAAIASMCVNEQSSSKFWKFHDIVFENQKDLEEPKLAEYAKKAGADMAKYNECYNSKKYQKFVEADMEYGEKLGVRSTPTFFVNGQIVQGALPFESFAKMIDSELSGS